MNVMTDGTAGRHGVGLVALWLATAAIAIGVGTTAVMGLGDQVRDRGPLGDNELVREAGLRTEPATPDPGAARVESTFSGEFGEFVVACQGRFATGVQARPDEAAGWRTISYEQGPDDDIDAVFSNDRRIQEVEIYCNQGRPVLAEIETNTIPDGSDDT